VRLGLQIGYWGFGGVTFAEQLELVEAAEATGWDSVWTAEAYGSDAATLAAWLAATTRRLRIGTAVMQMPARSPAMTAMTTVTLDRLSGGRMMLGLGSSGPQVAEGWHGQRFARQLLRTREYVAVVRKALARERLEFRGEHFRLPLSDGPGKALKLMIAPEQDRVPIYLAAIGPRNTELAGEIADGWIPTFFSPEHVGEFRRHLDAGAVRAGRSLDKGFDIAPMVGVCIDDDVDRARDAMRPVLALYIGGMGSVRQNFYNELAKRYGFERAAQDVQALYLAGNKRAAEAALPAELIDRTTLCGPLHRVAERLRVYRDAGVGTLLVTPMAPDPAERLRVIQALPELVG
jgi:F420-dependent oxidoreductase-like protein